jgi:hypothetical protein
MLTAQELQGLVQILNRAPVTAGEGLWLQKIINRLAAEVAPQQVQVVASDANGSADGGSGTG